MAGESDSGSAEASDSGSAGAVGEAAANETTSKTAYAVTDPGYESAEESGDVLAQLIAENTKKKPSETSDDASDTDDGEAEETAEKPAGDESADFDISDELLDRAVAVGYELDDIRDFKDAKAFEKELARVEKLQQRLQSKKGEAQKPDEAQAAEEDPEETEPNWEQLIADGHDPDLIAVQKRNWQRGTEARNLVKQLQQAEQIREANAQSNRFDEMLNGLGEQYEPILGKGLRAELLKSSPEAAQNRQKVFTMMTMLKKGYAESGQQVPSDSELIQQAFQAAFYKQAQEIAKNGLKQKLRNAGSQALSRPRSGSSRELAGPEKALQKEREFWKSFS